MVWRMFHHVQVEVLFTNPPVVDLDFKGIGNLADMPGSWAAALVGKRKPHALAASGPRNSRRQLTLCYAIVLPGRKLGFRAGFRSHFIGGSLKIGPQAGRRPNVGPILRVSRLESGRNPARKTGFRPGSIIA
jgi:hypothetical protein